MQQNLFPVPAPHAKLWRYLPFPGLIHLLKQKVLHFTRTDKFEDRLEGSFARVSLYAELIPHLKNPEVREVKWREARKGTAVNCWHASEYESLAMWELYAQRGIAVQSTYGRLATAIDDSHSVAPGFVEYVDHEKDSQNLPSGFAQFFQKGKSYAHEREFRLAVSPLSHTFVGPGGKTYTRAEAVTANVDYLVNVGAVPEGGIDIPVEPAAIIDKIHVSPGCPGWISDAVKTLVDALGYSFEVKKSDVDKDPIF